MKSSTPAEPIGCGNCRWQRVPGEPVLLPTAPDDNRRTSPPAVLLNRTPAREKTGNFAFPAAHVPPVIIKEMVGVG